MASGALEYALDGGQHAVEARDLGAQLALTRGGYGVVARAAARRRGTPLGGDPTSLLESLERRIERALLHGQHVAREPLDVLRDGVAMQRLQGECLQNEHVEG